MSKVVGVSFNDSKKIYYFLVNEIDVFKGDNVIVDTDGGKQFARVVTDIIDVDEKKLNNPLKNVIRIANLDDVNINENNIKDAEKALIDAKAFVKELGLNMQVLSACFLFDRKQLIFNFLAEERVDFRELAKKLAYVYKTRIELHQIGIRDKAKLVGGYGQCGRKLCCGSFLNDINSVSINMAKNQNIALNPNKINGACGRLLCCLSYEDDTYSELKKDLPKVGDIINKDGISGKVISVDVIKKTYRIETKDKEIIELS